MEVKPMVATSTDDMGDWASLPLVMAVVFG